MQLTQVGLYKQEYIRIRPLIRFPPAGIWRRDTQLKLMPGHFAI